MSAELLFAVSAALLTSWSLDGVTHARGCERNWVSFSSLQRHESRVKFEGGEQATGEKVPHRAGQVGLRLHRSGEDSQGERLRALTFKETRDPDRLIERFMRSLRWCSVFFSTLSWKPGGGGLAILFKKCSESVPACVPLG